MRRSVLKSRRETAGLLQSEVATAAGISRQALFAIEKGRATPSVRVALALAAALHTTVETLFDATASYASSPDVAGSTISKSLAASHGHSRRVVAARIGSRWVTHGLGAREHDIAADAIESSRGLELLRDETDLRANVIVMGCAPALGFILDGLNRSRDRGRFVWLARSSSDALAALRARTVHVGGIHLVDESSGESNVADLQRLAPEVDAALVTLAHWEVGLVVAKGNPKRARRAADVARRGVRLVTREKGAGARRMLEQALAREGAPQRAAASAMVALGHREVAQCIALGAVDVGPAVRDVAIAFGLDFVPLGSERFDLAIPRALMGDVRVARLLDGLTTARVRRELGALGYDARSTGARVA